jgi:diguanylate cyclase (GGDEF)-like protein/PAS domain S-box-containing protein
MATIQAGVMIIDVGKHTIADINMAAENLIGVKREAIIGKECHKYICPAEKGKCPITDLNQIVDRSERVLINAQGEQIPILKTVVPLTIKGRKYLLESFIDISERKRMEDELQRLAITDNLTQAYNRTKYEEVIKREIERTKRSSRPLSIAMFDIDHFKEVNDTYGHNVGDYVLKTLSQIAKKNIRDIDYLIRWGGEEFIVIALDTDLRGAEVMAEKIRHAIGNFSFDKVSRVTVSFGVTQFKQDDTEDSFIKRVDDALYRAKEKGRNRVEVTA